MQSLRSIAGSLATKAVQSSATGKFEVAQLTGNAYKGKKLGRGDFLYYTILHKAK